MTPVFSPAGNTVLLAAGVASSSVALTDTGEGAGTREVRVYNAGTATVFLAFGPSTVVAALATGIPVPPGTVEKFRISAACTHVAGITAADTANTYLTSGKGL